MEATTALEPPASPPPLLPAQSAPLAVMPPSTAHRQMTHAEFLALEDQDDGIERDLIRGELREWGDSMTLRTYNHSGVIMKVGHLLQCWLDAQTEPRGKVLGAEVGFRLRDNSSVGIDVAYITAAHKAATPKNTRYVEGAPLLAVEVLSPSDKHERVADKVAEYLAAGTALVWVVDPIFSAVTVHRPDARLQLFGEGDELTAEPHLPGFRVPVAEIFA